jgi:hypothetical protein
MQLVYEHLPVGGIIRAAADDIPSLTAFAVRLRGGLDHPWWISAAAFADLLGDLAGKRSAHFDTAVLLRLAFAAESTGNPLQIF